MFNLENLGRFITKKYKVIIIICSIFTFLMIFFMSKLTLNMQFMDILPKKDPAVIAYKEARKNFSSLDSIIVGVEGKKIDIENFIRDNIENLKKLDYINSIEYQYEKDFLKKYVLHLYKKEDLENMKLSMEANDLKEFIEGINENFEKTYTSSGDTEKIDKDKTSLIYYLNFLEDTIKKIQTGKLNKEDAEKFLFGERFFVSSDKKLGIFTIKSTVSIDDMSGIINSVNEIETLLNKSAKEYNVEVALTGTHVIARDEMTVSESDMTLTSTLSMILIFILFILAFRLLRYSLLVLVPLVCGIIWSMGLTYLLIGSLNMITAMMAAILIGLGIDYSIHIISYFLEERQNGANVEEAIIRLFQKVIKGVLAGAITTAIGFLMFSFSDFPGFSEFGIVLGLGIVCALVSALFFLPSLLMVFGKKEIKRVKTQGKFFSKLEKPIITYKKTMLVIGAVVLIFFIFKAKNIEFETDMMKIEAKGLKSVELNRKIIKKFDFSSDNSLLVSDSLEESQLLFDKADKLKTIGEISSIAQYLPTVEKQKRRLEIIRDIVKKSENKVSEEISFEALTEELYRLEDNLIELSDLAFMGGESDLQNKCDEIIDSGLISGFAETVGEYKEEILNSQMNFISSLKSIIKDLELSTYSIDEVPDNIKNNYISVNKNNKFLTTIFPKGNIWESNFQNAHIKELSTLDKNITGSALIFLKVVAAEIKEGKKVISLTIIAIYIILLIDLKSFKYATLAIIPMILTVSLTLGIMVVSGMKLDVVSVIGLPLIIGIGVDDGVHIIHRYLREKNLLTALSSTGRAVTLTTLTTIGAFGTLVLAKYRGFANFGKLLFLGVGGAYLVTIFFLISLIAIIDKIKLKEK